MGMSKQVKEMKVGDGKQHDTVVYFKQKRMEGVPISGSMLGEKAVQGESQSIPVRMLQVPSRYLSRLLKKQKPKVLTLIEDANGISLIDFLVSVNVKIVT